MKPFCFKQFRIKPSELSSTGATTDQERKREAEEKEDQIRQSNLAEKYNEDCDDALLTSLDETPSHQLLEVIFTAAGQSKQAMTIPIWLSDPLIRHYKYKFNYKSCVDLEGPQNLVYLETGGSEGAAYATISHYELRGNLALVIDLENEPKVQAVLD